MLTVLEKECKHCGTVFIKRPGRADNNRKYCTPECFTAYYLEYQAAWHAKNPGANKRYRKTRESKHPGLYREKARKARLHVIEILGGKCVVCGDEDFRHLQVDLIAGNTVEKYGYRHPRHARFIKDHPGDFQLLCANHHQEKTWEDRQ